jgi:hypothetical protein
VLDRVVVQPDVDATFILVEVDDLRAEVVPIGLQAAEQALVERVIRGEAVATWFFVEDASLTVQVPEPIGPGAHLFDADVSVGLEVSDRGRMENDPGPATLEGESGTFVHGDIAADVPEVEGRRQSAQRPSGDDDPRMTLLHAWRLSV